MCRKHDPTATLRSCTNFAQSVVPLPADCVFGDRAGPVPGGVPGRRGYRRPRRPGRSRHGRRTGVVRTASYRRVAPHRARARAIGSSSRPLSVNDSSTRGGISLKRLRNSSPSATICCRCLSRTPALISPGSRRRSSTGRRGRRASASAIDSVQRSPTAPSARASATYWP
jgi:hypothetical protein